MDHELPMLRQYLWNTPHPGDTMHQAFLQALLDRAASYTAEMAPEAPVKAAASGCKRKPSSTRKRTTAKA